MIISIANKVLFLVLTLCILANLGIAVYQTHTYIQITFGKQTSEQISLAPVVDMSQLQPLPTHPIPQRKPAFRG